MDKRVLLVEDDLDFQEHRSRHPRERGLRGHPRGRRSTGARLFAEFRGDGPALLVLDLMMPIVSGWQVLEAIREDPQLQLPVIVISASGLRAA